VRSGRFLLHTTVRGSQITVPSQVPADPQAPEIVVRHVRGLHRVRLRVPLDDAVVRSERLQVRT